MAKLDISTKHLAISKANTQMVIALSVASFVTVFCLIAAHSLWSQKNYQSRVVSGKEEAYAQLKANVKAVDSLVSSYQGFTSTPTNVIGGTSAGTGDNDGDNAKIILDALPSKYDFPALASSLEKLFKDSKLNVGSLSGTDDELAQVSNGSSTTPQPVTIPFSFTVNRLNYGAAQNLLSVLERSVRPIQIDTLTVGGGASDMQLTVNAHTYYQPAKDLKITMKAVK